MTPFFITISTLTRSAMSSSGLPSIMTRSAILPTYTVPSSWSAWMSLAELMVAASSVSWLVALPNRGSAKERSAICTPRAGAATGLSVPIETVPGNACHTGQVSIEVDRLLQNVEAQDD